MPVQAFPSACGFVRHKGKNSKKPFLLFGYLVDTIRLYWDNKQLNNKTTKPLNNPSQRVFIVFFFWCLCSCRCLWAGSRSVTETYENASAYRYGRCEAASIGKTSKDVFMVFFYLREKHYCAMVFCLVLGFRLLVRLPLLMEKFSISKANPTKNLQPTTTNQQPQITLP